MTSHLKYQPNKIMKNKKQNNNELEILPLRMNLRTNSTNFENWSRMKTQIHFAIHTHTPTQGNVW